MTKDLFCVGTHSVTGRSLAKCLNNLLFFNYLELGTGQAVYSMIA
jgi:hypothetical protein